MLKVLFLCVHNSARSQMAEAYFKALAGDKAIVESAGLEPGALNPYVVEAMAEDGIDISHRPTKSVFDFYKQGRLFDYVVTVCSKEAAERCPIFPGNAVQLHWPFADPSQFKGNHDEIMVKVREVRDAIQQKVTEFYQSLNM